MTGIMSTGPTGMEAATAATGGGNTGVTGGKYPDPYNVDEEHLGDAQTGLSESGYGTGATGIGSTGATGIGITGATGISSTGATASGATANSETGHSFEMGAKSGSTGSDQASVRDKSNSETGVVANRGPTGSVSGTASAGAMSQSGTSETQVVDPLEPLQ